MDKYESEITIRFRVGFSAKDKESVKRYTKGLAECIAENISFIGSQVGGYYVHDVRGVNERIVRVKESEETTTD